MKFRHLFPFLLGMCFSSVLQAQDNTMVSLSASAFQRQFAALCETSSLQSPMQQLAYNEEKYRKFKRMRTTGIVLTGVGAGLLTGGIVLLSSGIKENDGEWETSGGTIYMDADSPGAGKVVLGTVGIILGVTSAGGGITLWVIGNNKMKKYGNAVNLQSTKQGLGLAYSF